MTLNALHDKALALAGAAPQALLAQLNLNRSGGGGGGAGGGEALFLVSPWKPIVLGAVLLGWAWVVASVFDKDAERFFLPRKTLNLFHLGVGLVAIALVLFLPSFWIALPAVVALLLVHMVVYALKRNSDHRIPAGQRWSFDLQKMRAARAEREAAKNRKAVKLDFRGPSGLIPAPAKESPEAALRAAAEALIVDAVENRASRVELAPSGDNQTYTAAYVVDGVVAAKKQHPVAEAVAIIDFLKGASGLDVSDRRRRLRADLAVEMGTTRRKVRVISSGGSSGQRLTLLFDPESQVRIPIAEAGFTDGQRKELEAIIQEGQGVVIVATPPQSGRTNTLYAIVRAHDAYTTNVQTIEMEPSDTLEGVRANVFNPQNDQQEYSTLVRSILRRDPDVVAIAELPDAATAAEVTRGDLERTRVYVGMKAESALVAIQTFVKAVGDAEAAAKSLHGVVAGRLVRKLCQNCRVEYQPAPDLLKKLGLPADKVSRLFKKGGQVLIKNKPEVCPQCQGTGYFGQEGAFEVYQLDAEARRLIAASDLSGLRAALRKKRLPSIQEAAIHKVLAGTTSVEEVARITAAEQRPAAARPATKPTA